MTNFSELSIRGRVATSSDADWDEARQAWNLAADQRPPAVVFVESADDAAKAIKFAAENDLKVAGQGTGHGAVAIGSLETRSWIKTRERMRGIEVGNGTARIEAGVFAEEIGGAAHEKGKSFLPGTSPNVGVTGYSLGGGLSWFGRDYGWACNHVTAIELVRRPTASRAPWMQTRTRISSGRCAAVVVDTAIVTALHVDLFPVAEAYAGGLLFPPEVTEDGLRRYRDWTAEAPEEVGSMVRMLNLPPIPDIPEEIRGKKWLAITACCLGTREEGEKVIARLREIGEPAMNSFDQIPARASTRIAMDRSRPVPGLGHHADAQRAARRSNRCVRRGRRPETDSPLLLAELRHLGGALRRPADAGALGQARRRIPVMLGIGMLMDPALRDPIQGQLDKLHDAIKPWAADGGYYNYAERPRCDVEAILPEETCKRLST